MSEFVIRCDECMAIISRECVREGCPAKEFYRLLDDANAMTCEPAKPQEKPKNER